MKSIHFMFYCMLIGTFISCNSNKTKAIHPDEKKESTNDYDLLNTRFLHNQDSNFWDKQLLKQDLESFHKFKEAFEFYPILKSPFPVTQYDFAVSSQPFSGKINDYYYSGVNIGEYLNTNSDSIKTRLTLVVLSKTEIAKESTLVESRNYPYLTAQGFFTLINTKFDWVFNSSPDGYSTLNLNMKLFDLRFGQTILIYPQKNQAFFYEQLIKSPQNLDSMTTFLNELEYKY